MLRGLENSLSNAQAIATGALNTAIAQGDWRLMFLQHDGSRRSRRRISCAWRRRTSSRRTGRSATTFPTPAPDRTVVPAAPDLATTLRELQEHASRVARGETFDPTIAEHREPRRPLEAAQRHEGRGPAEEDGEQHRHRARSICASAIRRRSPGQREAASFAGGLLMAGTKTHTRQQIQDELRKLNAQVSVSGGGGGGRRRGGGGGGGGGGGAVERDRDHFGAGRELRRRRCGSRPRC